MTAPADSDPEPDLLSSVSDLDAISHLLADLHDDLRGKVTRFRYLADIDGSLGSGGTMIFGGSATFTAWTEARSSFVHGNFAATILLCQSLAENLLAAFLHAALPMEDLPPRIAFRETLKRCRDRDLITGKEAGELERLMSLRNPLSHFRPVDNDQNIDRRAMTARLRPEALIEQDASFAIGLAVRILGKAPFRLG